MGFQSPKTHPMPAAPDNQPLSGERSRIVAAARAHFLTHGFRGVTMADLAAELGMSKKTLYAHFESKDALLEAVLRDKFQGVEAELEKISARAGASFPEALHDLLAAMRR